MTSVLHAVWKKSRRCESGHCVEIADLAVAVGIRDSVSPQQHLIISPESFRIFVDGVKSGEFDRV
ncbi:DUF397 domain-containing protein [Catellatospora chokoriensis]|uniref:DUF397 domain-containing protein n=1 Tax=Catellatospora chokoriensis TaxID=310353 RepID=A0A8J3JYN7_9ACTN|nr:DUF397 domain-containing protein [Catellatospora chokoriensis]GIF89287.1 hypothetical protein Cch02nite_27310 [Catellatospora chokoriensis]